MKLSKSKLALAKLINENGGWVDGPGFASQDKVGSDHDGSDVCFYKYEPIFTAGKSMWNSNKPRGCVVSSFKTCVIIKNWHQTVLRREEYYQAYPKADADGWIEWKGGECPVEVGALIDVKYRDLHVQLGSKVGDRSAVEMYATTHWRNSGGAADIIAYRLHKPEVKPEFCESVARGIPEPESIDGLCSKVTSENKHQHIDAKPTIEQLAQDYRNKLDFANRKQQEVDEAKVAADAALGELERAGEEIGLLLSPIREGKKPEINIIDWRDLMVGDEIICSEDGNWNCDMAGNVCVVREIESQEYTGCVPILAEYCGASDWGDKFTFVRRP